MANSDIKLNGVLWVVCLVLAIGLVVHNFFFFPFIFASVYNWYLADFLKTANMDWRIANGASIIYAMLTMSLLKKSFKTESPSETIGHILGIVGGLWVIYLYAFLLKGVNFFQW